MATIQTSNVPVSSPEYLFAGLLESGVNVAALAVPQYFHPGSAVATAAGALWQTAVGAGAGRPALVYQASYVVDRVPVGARIAARDLLVGLIHALTPATPTPPPLPPPTWNIRPGAFKDVVQKVYYPHISPGAMQAFLKAPMLGGRSYVGDTLPPQTCPPGTVGVPPNCVASPNIPAVQCPPGTIGYPPNCLAPPKLCGGPGQPPCHGGRGKPDLAKVMFEVRGGIWFFKSEIVQALSQLSAAMGKGFTATGVGTQDTIDLGPGGQYSLDALVAAGYAVILPRTAIAGAFEAIATRLPAEIYARANEQTGQHAVLAAPADLVAAATKGGAVAAAGGSWWAQQSTFTKVVIIGGGALALVLVVKAAGSKGSAAYAANPRRRRGKRRGRRRGRSCKQLSLPSCRCSPPKRYLEAGARRPSDYALPECFMYPIHKAKYVRAAASRFGKHKRKYPPAVRTKIAKRIDRAKKRFGIGEYRSR